MFCNLKLNVDKNRKLESKFIAPIFEPKTSMLKLHSRFAPRRMQVVSPGTYLAFSTEDNISVTVFTFSVPPPQGSLKTAHHD